MFQKNYHVTDYQGLSEILEQMRNLIPDRKKAVLFLFDENFVKDRLLNMLHIIKKILPGVAVAGMTSHNRVFDHSDSDPIFTTLSLICFEESSFSFAFSDLTETSERRAAKEAGESLHEMEDVKGIFMMSSGGVDNQLYMEKILRDHPEISIFGATAAIRNHAVQESVSFLIVGDKIFHKAVLSVIFYGKDLHIKAEEEFGWTAIGKKMTVTKADGKNIVQEIDGSPAADIYEKYLGLRAGQIKVENVCEFPVFKKDGEHSVARISVSAGDDGAIRLGAPLAEGDEIRFSYGNPEEIIQTTERNAKELLPFGAQALFLVVCMNRIIFLGEEQEKEIDSFRKIQDNPVVIHGNSELFKDRTGGGELNSALVYIAMREGDAPQSAETVSGKDKNEARNEKQKSGDQKDERLWSRKRYAWRLREEKVHSLPLNLPISCWR